MERKKLIKFGIDWAAILALALCFIAFTAIKGTAFMSQSNMVNILRAMAITTVFGIAATITMAPDGFDMSAGTLGSLRICIIIPLVWTVTVYVGSNNYSDNFDFISAYHVSYSGM